MGKPQLFEIAETASARVQFPMNGRIEPVMLVAQAAERPHQRHVVDDINHFTVNRGGLVGEVVVQRPACGGHVKHRHHHDTCDHEKPADIATLTVPIRRMAEMVAMHGGNTFQTNMFSTVNTALEVAVMRLVSIPGSRSEK